MRRRTMLAPIRPRPTMPICIDVLRCPSVTRRVRLQRALERCLERLQTGADVCAQMHSECPSVTLDENRKVATCFSGLDDAERIFPAGHRNVRGVVAGNLEEDTSIRSPLVGL